MTRLETAPSSTLSRRGFIGLSAAAVAVLATGCSGGNGGAGRGALRIATTADPQLTALLPGNGLNFPWQHLVFDYLTELDENKKPQPRIAESWTQSADLLTLEVKLRKDVSFHDGRLMTPDDVIYSLQQAAVTENGSQLGFVAQTIKTMRASGSDVVTIELKEPTGQLFELFELTPIIDSKTFGDVADGKRVVGTGPFMWSDFHPGKEVNFVANKDYWGGAPGVDAVQLLVITQSQALIAAARSERSHITYALSPLDVSTLSGAGSLSVKNPGGKECYVLGFDASTQPFNDVAVRRAVAKAIDRARINDQMFKGKGTVSSLWWDDSTPGWEEVTASKWPYDPTAAKAEISQLGLTGSTIPLTVNGGDLMARGIMDIVRNNLVSVGLDIQPEVLESADFQTRNIESKLGAMFLHRTAFGNLSPATCASATAHLKPDGGTHFSTPEYLELIDAARKAGPDDVAGANASLGAYMVDQVIELALLLISPPVVVAEAVKGFRTTSAFQYLVADAVSL